LKQLQNRHCKPLKNSGIFWTIQGSQQVLTLRTARLGSHFDRDWDQAVALLNYY
jgi:hypothetical protein